MSTITDIFNPGGIGSTEPKVSELYSPTHKQGKGGVYKSVIRFLPWHMDPSNNMISKYVAYLVNPTNPNEGKYVDNPTENSPISNAYWAMVNTKDARFTEFAKKHLSSKKYYYALVQIMSDEQKPDLVGQIKVYRFAKKIWEKIHAELNPAQGDPINPFHPIYGRKFSLVITEQSGFPNYDQSGFFDERMGGGLAPSGMWYLNPQTNQMEVVTESTDQNLVLNYLRQYSPDLSKYAFREWNDSEREFVSGVLAATDNYMKTGSLATPQQATMQQSFGTLNNTPVANPVFPGAVMPASVPSVAPASAPVQSSPIPVTPSAPTQFAPPTPAMTQAPTQFAPPTAAPMPPQQMVSGVELPTVTPQGVVPGAPAPKRGMDVDDILGQL